MAYSDIDEMVRSQSLLGRVAACASTQAYELDPDEPSSWAQAHRYDVCSAPGWDAAWASAVAGGNPDPGADAAVITDPQILAQVQLVLGV